MMNIRIPVRADVERGNTWDLSKLFADDEAWVLLVLIYYYFGLRHRRLSG
jgi:hypothetical protein